jgi:hypothetical protein
MTNLQEMFLTGKNARSGIKTTSNSTANEQHPLSNVKPKRLAVLAKPRRCKPVAVSVFAWRGIKGPRLFC